MATDKNKSIEKIVTEYLERERRWPEDRLEEQLRRWFIEPTEIHGNPLLRTPLGN